MVDSGAQIEDFGKINSSLGLPIWHKKSNGMGYYLTHEDFVQINQNATKNGTPS
jgi:hypothetical protein